MSDVKTILESLAKDEMAKILPLAINKALNSYHEYMIKGIDHEKNKDFYEGHRAAKIAIAHIELLIKLARWVDLEQAESSSYLDDKRIQNLMCIATEDVKDYYDKNDKRVE